MPAGQRVRGPSSMVDETTGLVGLNTNPGPGGIWSLMVDGSAVESNEPARRMRARGAVPQAPSADDQALAAKMVRENQAAMSCELLQCRRVGQQELCSYTYCASALLAGGP